MEQHSFWAGLYNRFEANVNVNEKMYDILNIIKNKTTALNDYAKQLEKVNSAVHCGLTNQ